MDVCHLLLSRPWLFDNHVIHGEHANTYAFKHKGRSFSFTPLAPPKSLKSKPRKGSEKILFMSETRGEGVNSKNKPLFALLMVESNTYEVVASPSSIILERVFGYTSQ